MPIHQHDIIQRELLDFIGQRDVDEEVRACAVVHRRRLQDSKANCENRDKRQVIQSGT